MEIPKGYKVDELPKSVRFNLIADEGMFEYLISADKDFVQMKSRLLLKKANFLNEDYQYPQGILRLYSKKRSRANCF